MGVLSYKNVQIKMMLLCYNWQDITIAALINLCLLTTSQNEFVLCQTLHELCYDQKKQNFDLKYALS